MSKPVYQWILYALLVLFVAGCGGTTSPDDGSGAGQNGAGGGNGGTANPNSGGGNGKKSPGSGQVSAADSVKLIAESLSLPSGATYPDAPADAAIQLTALVTDSNNIILKKPHVTFSTENGSGTVIVQQKSASALLFNTKGHPKNRTVRVTATTANGKTDSLKVEVTGINLSLTGPSTISQGQEATFTAALTDSSGDGIGQKVIHIFSANGNTILKADTLTTNDEGIVTFIVVGNNVGKDTITVTALDGTEFDHKKLKVKTASSP